MDTQSDHYNASTSHLRTWEHETIWWKGKVHSLSQRKAGLQGQLHCFILRPSWPPHCSSLGWTGSSLASFIAFILPMPFYVSKIECLLPEPMPSLHLIFLLLLQQILQSFQDIEKANYWSLSLSELFARSFAPRLLKFCFFVFQFSVTLEMSVCLRSCCLWQL